MTTATKAMHTPGPWKAVFDDGGDHAIQGPNELVAVTSGLGYVPSETDVANARLIAACPEMLEALELLVKQGAFPTEAYEKALAVIRRARGGE